MKPVKVVRVIARLNTGGPARHVALLCERLTSLGYESLLVYGAIGASEGSLEHLASAGSFRSERVPELGRSLRPLDDVRALARLIRILFRERPAVVHTHTSKAGTLGRLAALVYNVSVPPARRCVIVHTFHGHVFNGYFGRVGSVAARAVERLLARWSDAIIAISPLQSQDLTGRYRVVKAAKVHVVPLALDLGSSGPILDRRRAKAELGFGGDDVVLGFVGRLVPVKAPALLLEAFAAARAVDSRFRLLVVGDGELRGELEEQARGGGIAGDVRFVGWREDLPAVYAAMDAVVLTSVNEGTPIALIEAAAVGLPVVATSVGGVPDVVTHGRHGLLTPSGDAHALADAFLTIARSEEERTRMGQAARQEIVPRFSPDRLMLDIHTVYERCFLARSGARASVGRRAAPGAEG